MDTCSLSCISKTGYGRGGSASDISLEVLFLLHVIINSGYIFLKVESWDSGIHCMLFVISIIAYRVLAHNPICYVVVVVVLKLNLMISKLNVF